MMPSMTVLPVHKAVETFPEELELFEKPTVQHAIESSFYTNIAPLTNNLNAEVLEFDFISSDFCIDPADVYLYLKCKIENAATPAASVAATSNHAGPVNAFFYMLFERIDIELNGIPIEAGFNNLPFKGYYNCLFNCSHGVRKTMARGILWDKDTANQFDDADPTKDGKNVGLRTRTLQTKDERIFELFGRPMHELFYMRNFLLPNVRIRIKLYRKDPAFALMSNSTDPKFKINFLEATLKARHIKLEPKVLSHLEKKLSATTPACYVLPNCVEVRDRQLVAGSRVYSIENFFATERLPSKVTFALLPHSTYIGSYKHNPLKFSTHGLEEISLTIDNQTDRYSIDETGKNYIQLYNTVASELGNEDQGTAENISYDDLLTAYAFFPFDLSPSRLNCDLEVPRIKNVRLELKFKAALKEPLELLCFTETSHIFHIDKIRKVTKIC